ncbi:hypothetical protein QTP88_020801 [Uroleucon formosanum]
MQANKQRSNQNSPSKDYLTKGITRIRQLNVEGFSKSKAEVLERIATEEKIDVLVVQETHTADQEQLSKRGHITGFTIAGATFHSKYGTATYIKSDLKWNHIRTSEENSIYTIETQVGNLHVTNIYKPPNTIWPTPVLHSPNYPTIYIGDFNSHNTMWGYNENDTQGELIINTAKKSIPRGYRKNYVPGWNDECETLYSSFNRTGNYDYAKKTLEALNNQRRERWIQLVEKTDFKHSSHKTWSLLRLAKPNGESKPSYPPINPNQIANHILGLSRASSNKQFSKETKSKLAKLKSEADQRSVITAPFSVEEINSVIEKIKTGKSAGKDGIFPEFFKHCGVRTRLWLTAFFNNILENGKIPAIFKDTKIIAICKPKKPNDLPQSYRPIALLSVSYKLLERLIYNRISPIIDQVVPKEQAGFRPHRSCTDQVAALTTFIENGFQKNLKTTAVLVDLTAAYDTFWRTGLLTKLLELFPCLTLYKLMNEMLSNRTFVVHLGEKHSKPRRLNDGLPQWSVLTPILFNLYISDLPNTISRKFIYADDITLAVQNNKFEVTEKVLSEDLDIISTYLHRWRLKPNINKTVVTSFHLNNRLANYQPKVTFRGSTLNYDQTPTYLGVTLDRQLTYKKHIEKTAAKLKTRNNIIQKLAGSSWGASTSTLRTSSLALVYSAAEYACPVWINSSHCSKIDVQLNHSMRIISGTVKSTPTQWLPVLCNIFPPSIRRKSAGHREWSKYADNQSLPIHQDTIHNGSLRLKSRKPAHISMRKLIADRYDGLADWKSEWEKSNPDSHNIKCLLQKPNCESSRTFVSSIIFRILLLEFFSNTFDNIGSRLIGMYDDETSGGFFGLRMSMIEEYFHWIGK